MHGTVKKKRSGNLTNVFCFCQNLSESTNSLDLVGVPPLGKENGLVSSTVKVCVIPVRFLQSMPLGKGKDTVFAPRSVRKRSPPLEKDLYFYVKILSQILEASFHYKGEILF